MLVFLDERSEVRKPYTQPHFYFLLLNFCPAPVLGITLKQNWGWIKFFAKRQKWSWVK